MKLIQMQNFLKYTSTTLAWAGGTLYPPLAYAERLGTKVSTKVQYIYCYSNINYRLWEIINKCNKIVGYMFALVFVPFFMSKPR